MSNNKDVPIIFLASAKRDDSIDIDDLRNLPEEIRGITNALDCAVEKGWCEVIEKAYVTTDIIFDVFQKHANRIAVFHFAGHANSFKLMLQDSPADKEGLIPFLARQNGLSLVFLNGCSTAEQTHELVTAGIPAAIGTNEDIEDEIAKNISIRFYKGLASGLTLEKAWEDAINEIKAGPDEYRSRGFRRPNLTGEPLYSQYPWEIEYNAKVAEEIKNWSLPGIAKDHLFGLPPIPEDIDYPKPPFRYLERYERKHARIFFGRSDLIRKLFGMITKPGMAPLILLYGQSGVGKSSLLESGVFPRLESDYDIVYKRRSREKGLAQILQEVLEKNSNEKSVIILDQVEEMFTDPNPTLLNEFDDFMRVLAEALKLHVSKEENEKLTIVLSFRKEYLAEINEKLKEVELDSNCSELFVTRMGRSNIIEVVKGLTSSSVLKNRYNLEIDEDLPDCIANDLLKDRTTPVAPVLQFIMSKMWDLTDNVCSETRFLKMDDYLVLTKDGITMKTFFDNQMKALAAWNNEVVESGLVLDILKAHTTEMGTARFKSLVELRQEYAHREDILQELLTTLKKYYLLTDVNTVDKQQGTSLAHDTLAPVVINEYNESDKPGQNASRIFASKMRYFQKNRNDIRLDETDLKIIERGKEGMRFLSDNEEESLKISWEYHHQLEKDRRFDKEKRIEANALRLAEIAKSVEKRNPTVALRIAEKAWRLDPNPEVTETIHRIYRKNDFYRIVAKHESHTYSIAFSPSGKTILTGSEDNIARLWDLKGKILQEFRGHEKWINSVAFSSDGKTILTGSDDSTTRLWDLQGKVIQEFEGHISWVTSAVFSPDGKTILTGSGDDTARLWDLKGKTIQEFKGHKNEVTSVAFSPDGKTIVTGSCDNTARLWDLKGNTMQEFKGHSQNIISLAFSPDGQTILTGSWDRKVRLWDLKGNTIQVFKGHTDDISSVAFSPDGQTILTGSYDNTARLWDLKGNTIQVFRGHYEAISSVVFSPNGKTILTCSSDKTTRLWWIKASLEKFLEKGNLKPLTLEQKKKYGID